MQKISMVLRATLAAGLYVAAGTAVHAQGITGIEQERALRSGVYIPYDGAGFSHRYNYELGGMYYFNYDYRQLYRQDYLDRLDRWERAGHLWPSASKGPAYQLQRIENEYYLNLSRYRGPLFWDWRW